jgi:hypothetical protein
MFFLGGIPATGTVGLYRSVDGFSWSRVDAVSLFVSVIATGGGRTVVVSSGGAPISVAVTTNGYQWSYGTMQFGSVAGIAYGNGVFIAVTPTAAECAVSSDGLSWTTYSTPAATTGICFGNGVFLIMAAGAIYTSTNGSSWTYIGAASGECWNPMYVDGVFFIHNGSNGTITAYSPSEGIFQCEVPQAAYWYRAAYGNGVYYAGAAAWADSTKRLLYSENGYDWFPVTGFKGSVGALVYGNGRIIAAPYTSGDPIHTAGYCIDSSVIA